MTRARQQGFAQLPKLAFAADELARREGGGGRFLHQRQPARDAAGVEAVVVCQWPRADQQRAHSLRGCMGWPGGRATSSTCRELG